MKLIWKRLLKNCKTLTYKFLGIDAANKTYQFLVVSGFSNSIRSKEPSTVVFSYLCATDTTNICLQSHLDYQWQITSFFATFFSLPTSQYLNSRNNHCKKYHLFYVDSFVFILIHKPWVLTVLPYHTLMKKFLFFGTNKLIDDRKHIDYQYFERTEILLLIFLV